MLPTSCSRLTLGLLAFAPAFSVARAQDTAYPARGQQIPVPDCLNLHNVWENVPQGCPPFTHQRWLADISHWRAERRIQIGRAHV